MSRIGMIRAVLVGLGGFSNPTYYADGPTRSGGRPGVLYKISRYGDGLTDAKRLEACELLAKLPGVEKSYISRKVNMRSYYSTRRWPEGGHIKVKFTNKAK